MFCFASDSDRAGRFSKGIGCCFLDVARGTSCAARNIAVEDLVAL